MVIGIHAKPFIAAFIHFPVKTLNDCAVSIVYYHPFVYEFHAHCTYKLCLFLMHTRTSAPTTDSIIHNSQSALNWLSIYWLASLAWAQAQIPAQFVRPANDVDEKFCGNFQFTSKIQFYSHFLFAHIGITERFHSLWGFNFRADQIQSSCCCTANRDQHENWILLAGSENTSMIPMWVLVSSNT